MSTPETPRTWTLVFCEDCGEMLGVQDHVRVRDEHFGYAGHRGMRFVEAYEAGPVDVERERLLDLLEEIATSGVAFEDDRLRYLDVQIDRGDWEQLLALLREYGRLGKEES